MSREVSPEQLEAMLTDLDDLSARVLRLIWEEDQETEDATVGMAVVADDVQLIASSLGLPPIGLLEKLDNLWPDLAGPQWASKATPLVVRHGELVVEAADRRIVRWLRHDTGRLMERIAECFGPGFVTKVRVVGPAGRRGW